MAKRMTDTEKWKKQFLRALDAPYKLLWMYILDDCDMAGIWHVDLEVAEIRIGEQIEMRKAVAAFGDRIAVFDGGKKWFIKDFISFQYGELKQTNRMHVAVMATLKKNYPETERGASKGLTSPQEYIHIQGQEKEQGQIPPPNFEDVNLTTDTTKKNSVWFRCCIDELYFDQLKSAHTGKDIELAIKESYAHLAADSKRHAMATQSDVKKLVNTWLTNQKKDDRSGNSKTVNGVKSFAGNNYAEPL